MIALNLFWTKHEMEGGLCSQQCTVRFVPYPCRPRALFCYPRCVAQTIAVIEVDGKWL